jgi:hypothetical protein
MTVGSWVERVRDAVTAVTGPQWTDEAARGWAGYAGHPVVRVTIYGPYDAGKSTLLKRILVEDGTPVPDWLTISARPETFTVNEVVSGGIGYVDTPGIAGANTDHERLADAALLRTDALLVAVPPQLLGPDADRVRSIVTGTFVGADAPVFAPGSVLLVITRADNVGINPVYDLEGYREVCAEKRDALSGVLGRPDCPVWTVVADHRARTRSVPAPGPDAYAESREWDGIEDLRTALAGLPARKAALRSAAEVRYWAWCAGQAYAHAEAELERLAQAMAEASGQRTAVDLVESELSALDGSAIAELTAQVDEELRNMVDAAAVSTSEELGAEASRRLQTRLTAWSMKWSGELGLLARRAEVGFDDRAARPGSDAFRAYLADLAQPHTVPSARGFATEAGRLSATLTPSVQQLVRAGYELKLGMPLETARAELGVVESLRRIGGDKLDGYFAKGGLIRDLDHAETVRSDLFRAQLLGEVVPAVLGLQALWSEARRMSGEDEAEEAAARKREALRGELGAVRDRIVNWVLDGDRREAVPNGWRAAIAALRTALQASRPPDELVETMEQRQGVLVQARSRLRDLLARPELP